MPADAAPDLDVSVVVPVYHNEATLEELCRRLVDVLEGEGVSFEILCVDEKALLAEARAACARLFARAGIHQP